MHSIMPYAIDRTRIVINLGIVVVAVFSVIYGVKTLPRIVISDDLRPVITVINVIIQFVAAVILLYLGQYIRLIISHINQYKST